MFLQLVLIAGEWRQTENSVDSFTAINPATGHPGFTAVGMPASLLRFAARHSYDNVRPYRLPPPLQDKNPTGSKGDIDLEWTQRYQ